MQVKLMKRLPFVLLALMMQTSEAVANPSHVAVGAAPAWEARSDYGEGGRMNFVPELLGFAYFPTGRDRYHLRAGARVGLSGLSQAEMPSAVRIPEWDIRPALELGLLRDGPFIPVLAMGIGAIARHTSLQTTAAITKVDGPQSHTELLPRAYVHAGLGIPLGRNLVLEPFGRYEVIVGDTRSSWRLGLDISVAIF